MTELRALGFWDDNTYYPCLLKDVEEPRKSVDQYKIGEKIKTRIRGFKNYYTGEIIAISYDLKELKTLQKELESKNVPPSQTGTKRKSVSSGNNDQRDKKKQADDNGQQTNVNDNTQAESKKQKKGKKTDSEQATQADRKRLAKEETARKKAVEAARNSSFLQSLEVFKEKVQQPVEKDSSDASRTPLKNQQSGRETLNCSLGSPGGWIPQNSSTPVASPSCVWQNSASDGRDQQNWTPVRPQLTRTDLNWQTPEIRPSQESCTALVSREEGPVNDSVYSQPIGTVLQEARMALEESHETNSYLDLSQQETNFSDVARKGQTNPCQRCQSCDSLKERVQDLEEQLRRSRQENMRLQQQISSPSMPLNSTDSQPRLQRDGKPRAGLVKPDQAEQYKMVELMPGTSVYVYPATLRAVQKLDSQTAKARSLLSAFYSNAELVHAGNLTGANGKPGLDAKIVDAIVDYSLLQGLKSTAAEIRSALRRKITGLTSWTANKNNSF